MDSLFWIPFFSAFDFWIFYWLLVSEVFTGDGILRDHLVHKENRTEKCYRSYRNQDFQPPIFFSAIPGLRLAGYTVLFNYYITFSENKIILFVFHSLVQGEGQKCWAESTEGHQLLTMYCTEKKICQFFIYNV